MATERILIARSLTACIDGKVLVDGIDLDVERNGCVCVVGLNSAGKSVLLRVLSGLHVPTSGSIKYGDAGRDIRVSGVWSGRAALYPRLTVQENCCYLARLGGVGSKIAAQRTAELVAALGLGGRQRTMVSKLSSGMKMRAAIAAALVASPDLLILDEPDSNQDQEGIQQTLQTLSAYSSNGGTIIFASHNADMVQNLADRVVGLRNGRIHFSFGREAFSQVASSMNYYVLQLLKPVTNAILTLALPEVRAISPTTLLVPGQGDILMAALRAADKVGIADLRLVKDPVERLFFQAEALTPC